MRTAEYATEKKRGTGKKLSLAVYIRHSPFVTRHSLLAIRYSPFVTHHSLLAIRYSPFVTRHSSLAIRHSSFTIRRSPFVIELPTRSPQAIAGCLLPICQGLRKVGMMQSASP